MELKQYFLFIFSFWALDGKLWRRANLLSWPSIVLSPTSIQQRPFWNSWSHHGYQSILDTGLSPIFLRLVYWKKQNGGTVSKTLLGYFKHLTGNKLETALYAEWHAPLYAEVKLWYNIFRTVSCCPSEKYAKIYKNLLHVSNGSALFFLLGKSGLAPCWMRPIIRAELNIGTLYLAWAPCVTHKSYSAPALTQKT